MRSFYEHLVRREIASESLHQAMKWMRCNGFAKVSDWATFMLIRHLTLEMEVNVNISL